MKTHSSYLKRELKWIDEVRKGDFAHLHLHVCRQKTLSWVITQTIKSKKLVIDNDSKIIKETPRK